MGKTLPYPPLKRKPDQNRLKIDYYRENRGQTD